MRHAVWRCFFFFNDTATTEIYTLSLHDALPIFHRVRRHRPDPGLLVRAGRHEEVVLREDQGGHGIAVAVHLDRTLVIGGGVQDRKSTRLNSSHANISYAVFCLKKKKKNKSTSIYSLPSCRCSYFCADILSSVTNLIACSSHLVFLDFAF